MTGHTTSSHERTAVARLDRDTLRAVALAYRARRQEGTSDGPAYEAAVAELHSRAPGLPDRAGREAVSLIITRAATEAQAWFWRGTNHGWPPPLAGPVKACAPSTIRDSTAAGEQPLGE